MAIQAAAGGCFNTTFTSTGTKQNLADSIETALLAAGWTTVSGHGTTNLLMQSAVTPYGHQMNFRFKASTNCCVISIESTDGTSIVGGNSTTAGIHLLPTNTKVFRVIANKYQFCILVDADVGPVVAREFAFGSVPYVPSFLTGVTFAGLLMGNSFSDASATLMDSWRAKLGITQNNAPNFQAVYGSTLLENANLAGNNVTVCIMPVFCEVPMTGGAGAGRTDNTFYDGPIHWANGDLITADAWIAFGNTLTSESTKRFELWDAIILLDSFTAGATPTTTTVNGRTCQNVTHSNAGSGAMGTTTCYFRGSLFLFTQ